MNCYTFSVAMRLYKQFHLLSLHFSCIVRNLITKSDVILRHGTIILNFQKLSRFSCLDFHCLDYPRIFAPIFLLRKVSLGFFLVTINTVLCNFVSSYILPNLLLIHFPIVSIISSLLQSSLSFY